MSSSLYAKLLSAEQELLLSLSQGPAAVDAFDQSWSAIQKQLENAIASSEVNEETLTLAHHVFSRVEILSSRFLELYEQADVFTSSLQKDLDDLFSTMSLEDPSERTGIKHLLCYLTNYANTIY